MEQQPSNSLISEFRGMGEKFLALSNLGKNGALRWLGGACLILFLWLVIGGFATLPFLFIGGANFFTSDLSTTDPFWLFLAVNAGFPFIWLGVWLVVRVIQQRPFRTLITYLPKISWGRLAQGFVVWLVLGAIAQIIDFALNPARAVLTFDAARWFTFLPFVLILTPIQTSAEELLFRGYFLQGFGRLVKNPILLVLIGGALFGIPHLFNPEIVNNPGQWLLLFLNYFLTGSVFTLYTLRDNRLELALGAHMSNNLFAALIVNYQDSALTTPALFTTPAIDPLVGLVTLILISTAFYVIVFRLLGRAADASN